MTEQSFYRSSSFISALRKLALQFFEQTLFLFICILEELVQFVLQKAFLSEFAHLLLVVRDSFFDGRDLHLDCFLNGLRHVFSSPLKTLIHRST